MKKQEFMDELRSHLKVLEDEEQNDIIDEYFQHIEMKIESGLDEEEAIRDFGPVQELAAQILEAYHVKPEYEKEMAGKPSSGRFYSRVKQAKETGEIKPFSALAGEKIKSAGRAVQTGIKKAGKLTKDGFCLILWLIGIPFKKVGQLWKYRSERWEDRMEIEMMEEAGEELTDLERAERPETAEGAEIAEGPEIADTPEIQTAVEEGWTAEQRTTQRTTGQKTIEQRPIEQRAAGQRNTAQRTAARQRPESRRQKSFGQGAVRGLVRFMKEMVKSVLSVCLWCCRLSWNLLILVITAGSALLGLVFLFLLGVLFVLQIQGYPLAGILIGCVGAVLCFVSLSVCSCTFFWKKGRCEPYILENERQRQP